MVFTTVQKIVLLLPNGIHLKWQFFNFEKSSQFNVFCPFLAFPLKIHLNIKHEYLRAYICLSLSSPFPSCDISSILTTIEILVLTSWIPASKNFVLQNRFILSTKNHDFWNKIKLVERELANGLKVEGPLSKSIMLFEHQLWEDSLTIQVTQIHKFGVVWSFLWKYVLKSIFYFIDVCGKRYGRTLFFGLYNCIGQ